jgi:hypothetical protein
VIIHSAIKLITRGQKFELFIHTYIHTHTHTYVHTHSHIHAYTHMHTYIMHAYIHTCTHTYYTHTHTHTVHSVINCRFPAPSWNCMTHRQALKGFPDTIHKSNKINLSFFIAVPTGSREVTFAFNFISELSVHAYILQVIILNSDTGTFILYILISLTVMG